jgi:hypothetical protein
MQESKKMTFDEVSHPYIEQFGFPDQTLSISLEDEVYEQYYWYKEDVIAEFVCPKNNQKDGWEISFALSMDPLKYYKEGE